MGVVSWGGVGVVVVVEEPEDLYDRVSVAHGWCPRVGGTVPASRGFQRCFEDFGGGFVERELAEHRPVRQM